jgi:hypothetical protein
MAFSGPPQFPIVASLFPLEDDPLHPSGPAYLITCSCAPLPAATYTFQNVLFPVLIDTIIRVAKDVLIIDHYEATLPQSISPCSVLEIPAGSGNFYAAVYSHIVGRGFPNEFRSGDIGLTPRGPRR